MIGGLAIMAGLGFEAAPATLTVAMMMAAVATIRKNDFPDPDIDCPLLELRCLAGLALYRKLQSCF